MRKREETASNRSYTYSEHSRSGSNNLGYQEKSFSEISDNLSPSFSNIDSKKERTNKILALNVRDDIPQPEMEIRDGRIVSGPKKDKAQSKEESFLSDKVKVGQTVDNSKSSFQKAQDKESTAKTIAGYILNPGLTGSAHTTVLVGETLIKARKRDVQPEYLESKGEKNRTDSEANRKKKQGVKSIILGSLTFGSVPLLIGIIVIVPLSVLLSNLFSWIFSVSLVEGYAAMVEEQDEFDGGYDRATYLASKYGQSSSELFRYELDGVYFIGDDAVSQLMNMPIFSSIDGLHLYRAEPLMSDLTAATSVVETMVDEIQLDVGFTGAVFWFDSERVDEFDVSATAFTEYYQSLILNGLIDRVGIDVTGSEGTDNIAKVLVLSILPLPESDKAKTEEINDALRTMCLGNKGWCFVDLDELIDANTFDPDSGLITDDFWRFKLIPFLCSILGKPYSLGRSILGVGDMEYGVYGITAKVSLYDMVEYLFTSKNDDTGIYDSLSDFVGIGRSTFQSTEVMTVFDEAWKDIIAGEGVAYPKKMYADQQGFLVDVYYRERLKPYLESTYHLDISGASYAFKAAVISLALEFGYRDSASFGASSLNGQYQGFFTTIDWHSPEDEIIAGLYDHAITIDLEHSLRWEREKADCLAMYNGTLDIYQKSQNEYGYIDWSNHLSAEGAAPTDLSGIAPEDPRGTGIIVIETGYIPDHDETGGDTAEAYAAFALSFADPPELYGSGVYILPYVWGGASLVTGADCSGFVGQILARYGYLDQGQADIHGYSSGDFPALGTGVDLSDIRVGDIVCYSGHVAIYIGNGQIVHEPSNNRSCGVEIGNVFVGPITALRRFDLSAPSAAE